MSIVCTKASQPRRPRVIEGLYIVQLCSHDVVATLAGAFCEVSLLIVAFDRAGQSSPA